MKWILITSILTVCAFGVGGSIGACLILNNNSTEQTLRTSFGLEDLVWVAESTTIEDLDTVEGSIECIGLNFLDLTKPLPLCITQEMANQWSIKLRVCGGYEPKDVKPSMDYGIFFWQKGAWVQGWNIDWTNLGKDLTCGCCNCYIWEGKVFDCGNKVCLDSNQYPDLGPDFVVNPACGAEGVPYETIPDKEVDIKIKTLWSGCDLEDQEFTIIPIQKNLISRENPQL